MYYILRNEPDGWAKAYAVCFAGLPVAWFHYRDSAEAYIKNKFA